MEKESFWSYVACALDGEGTLQISNHFDKRVNRYYYYPIVSVANTEVSFLDYLKNGSNIGSIYSSGRRQSPKHKAGFKWGIGNYNEIEFLLNKVLPYLIIKRKQALLILEFLSIYKEQKRKAIASTKRDERGRIFARPSWANYTQRQHEIFEQIRKLNQRGRNDGEQT